MGRTGGIVRRMFAVWMAAVLLVVSVPELSFAEQYGNFLDGWSVECVWSDLNAEYEWNAAEDEGRQPKLMFTYHMEHAGRDYPAGSLSVSIPGIGGAVRAQVVKASKVAADREDSEWEYTWDQKQDVYIFTNLFEVKEGQSLSGGFELMWTLKARDCTDGYEQSRSPVFSVEGAGAVTLEPLSYRFHSVRDRYRIAWSRSRLTSQQTETADPDYVWYEYQTRFDADRHARGIYRSGYAVRVLLPDGADYGAVKVCKDGRTCGLTRDAEGNWCLYPFRDRRGDLSTESGCYTAVFQIGFLKDTLNGQRISLFGHLDRMYQDEAFWTVEAGENEVVDVEDSVTVEEYGFTYAGYTYQIGKYNQNYESSANHSEPADYTDRLNAVSLYTGQVVEFILQGSAKRRYTELSGRLARGLASPSNMSLASLSDISLASPSNEVVASPSDQTVAADPDEIELTGIDEDMAYDLILGDDRLAVYQSSGELRPLEDEEYDIVYVTVPADSQNYEYQIYGGQTQDMDFAEYELIGTGSTGEKKSFLLPEGCKAVFVRVNGTVGNRIIRAAVGIRFHFDWEAEQMKAEGERIDQEGRVVNFACLRASHKEADQTEVRDNVVGPESYVEIYGEELAERDWLTYGEYQQRSYSNVWLRSPVTEVKVQALLHDFWRKGKDRFETTISAMGTVRADENGPLERFSLYAVLPDGLYQDLVNDDIRFSGSGTYLTGEQAGEFGDYVTVRKGEWNGRAVIAADFDFAGEPLNAGSGVNVSMSFPSYLSYADYLTYGSRYTVTAFLMPHDGGLDRISGEAVVADEYDIDEDGIWTEQMAYHIAGTEVADDVAEWRGYNSKYVRSSYSESYVQDTVVKRSRADGTAEEKEQALYSYRLDFGLGASNGGNIVMYDRIEQGATVVSDTEVPDQVTEIPSGWQGELQRVDTDYAERMGMAATVYYSVDGRQELSLEAEGWTSLCPADKSAIRAVAVSLDTSGMEHGVMKAGQLAYVVIHMKAPADTSLVGKQAVNQYRVTYDAYDMEQNFEKSVSLDSSETRVKLLDTVGQIVLQKEDLDHLLRTDQEGKPHYASLTGAVFQIYDAGGNPLFGEQGKPLSSLGRITIAGVPYGTYYYEELKAPAGYKRIEGRQEFQIDGVTEVLPIPNRRIGGEVVLSKTDADDPGREPLPGAEFELYRLDGRRIFTDEANVYSDTGTKGSFLTDDTGRLCITGLPWGSYRFVETKAPGGYEKSEKPVEFHVGKAQYDSESDRIVTAVTADNRELTTDVLLRKTDAVSGNPLKDACYDLYQKKENGDGTSLWVKIREFLKTNAAGELQVTGLRFGTFQFREVAAPRGYRLSKECPEFVLDAGSAGEPLTICHSDERKTGSALMKKLSEDGFPLSGAVYSLYREESSTPAAENLITDEEGRTPTVTELTWGRYYFVETRAPKGYETDSAPVWFTIDAEQVDLPQQLQAVNSRTRGRVTLVKLDAETGSLRLPGAEFCLYGNDGGLVQDSLVTGADGSVTVENLNWGSYYFEEKKAPDGYGISGDKIRFSVNRDNCAVTQTVISYDPLKQAEIRIHKEINEQYEPFGLPVFIYEISGRDVSQTEHRWIRTITLDGENSGETILSGIPAGTYTVTELEGSRYSHTGMTPGKQVVELLGVEEIPEPGQYYPEAAGAVVDLTTEPEGEVWFHNEMTQYEQLSHMTSAVNMVAARKKLTGFSVNYRGPAVIESDIEDTYTFSAEDLDGVAVYDDGSTGKISFDELLLNPASVTGDFNTSGAGYTVQVSYCENGLTVSDSFSVEIRLQLPVDAPKVIYDANGGYFNGNPDRALNVVYYQPENTLIEERTVRKTAKTRNVSSDGESYVGKYGDSLADTQMISIPGATSLHVKIQYQTQGAGFDWVCIYGPEVTPSETNFDSSISGKLAGRTKTVKEYEIPGDTIQFFMRTDPYNNNYYGYYAEVTGVVPEHEGNRNTIVSGSYQQPEHSFGNDRAEFAGWYTDEACISGSEFDPEHTQPGEMIRVYAKWNYYHYINFELNGGMIVPESGAAAQSTLTYKIAELVELESPKYKPTNGDLVFWGWYLDDTFTTEAVFPLAVTENTTCYARWGEYADVKYAVTVYGIRHDTYREEDGTTGTAGLTFGPAAAGDFRQTYVSHVPSGVTETGNLHRCIHEDDWTTIAEWSQRDPYVYEQCMGNRQILGCTKSVPLIVNEENKWYSYTDMKGDGAGVLMYSLADNKWNYGYTGNTVSTAGGWPASRIRAMMNGADEYTNKLIDGSDALINGNPVAGTGLFDRSQTIFDCFPEELKRVIVPKAVKSDTVVKDSLGNNLTTYDRLWLFSVEEWYGGNSSRPNEGYTYGRRVPQGKMNSMADELGNRTYCLLRSIFSEDSVWTTTTSMGIRANVHRGISPGFCLR